MSLAESFGRSGFAQFIGSTTGRILRVIVGLLLICWGYLHAEGNARIAFMLIGLVPLSAGVFNLCFISALLGGPLRVARITKPNP